MIFFLFTIILQSILALKMFKKIEIGIEKKLKKTVEYSCEER